MTKEEIVKAIRVCAKKLHRNPSLRELRAMSGVTTKHVYKRLGSLRKALQAAGLEGIGPGFSPAEETVLRDWASVARKLKKLPSIVEYERAGRFSGKPFQRLYGSWAGTAEGFCKFVSKQRLKPQWGDVLKMIAGAQAQSTAHDKVCGRHECHGNAGHSRTGQRWKKEIPQRWDFARPSGLWPSVAVAGAGARADE